MTGCLHLKTAVTALADEWPLVNPQWVDVSQFIPFRVLEVHADEPFAENVLRIGDVVLCAQESSQTRLPLGVHGLNTTAVDLSELAKAEAGLTCCSPIVRTP